MKSKEQKEIARFFEVSKFAHLLKFVSQKINGKLMSRISCSVFALFLLFGGCKSTKTASRIDGESNRYTFTDRLDTLFKNSIARKEVPGAVCLISERGKIVYNKAFGHRNIEQGLPMEKSSLFRMKSMNKPLISIAVLKLASEGKIKLDDPADKYFTELKDKKVGVVRNGSIEYVPANRPITLRHLLSHSSGLGGSGNAGALKSIYENYERSLFKNFPDSSEAYMKLPLIDQPGIGWFYGQGHKVMARLIEKVSGKPYRDYLEKEIFRPLGLNHTTFALTKGQEKDLAQFYAVVNGELKKTLADSTYTGGDDLMSSAEDYYKLCTLLLNNGYLNDKLFIAPSLIKELSTPVVGLDGEAISWLKGYGFALGVAVRVNEEKAVIRGTLGDYGWFGFFNTAFWVDSKKQIIGVVLTQSYHNYYRIPKEVKNIIYSEK